jgi:hypothetical protein
VLSIQRNPSQRDLLVFGWLLGPFVALLGLVLQVKLGAPGAARFAWIVGGVVVALFAFVPRSRRPIYLGWIYATFPIGWVVSNVLLAAIYYLVFTPLGWLLRAAGRDPMSRRLDRSAASYWVEHDPDQDPKRYLRQY